MLFRSRAAELADEVGARLISVSVDPGAHVLRIRLRRAAHTTMISRIDAIRSWGVATADGQAGIN